MEFTWLILTAVTFGKAFSLDFNSKASFISGFSDQYRSQNTLGEYTFGYNEDHASGGSFRREAGDRLGNKAGSYGLRAADGRVRVVNYVADGDGFRADVVSNEPGLQSQTPNGQTRITRQSIRGVMAPGLRYSSMAPPVGRSGGDGPSFGERLVRSGSSARSFDGHRLPTASVGKADEAKLRKVGGRGYFDDGAANQEDGRRHLDDVATYQDGRRLLSDGVANQENGGRYLGDVAANHKDGRRYRYLDDGAANQEDGRMHLDDVAANYEDGRRYIVDGAANQEDGRRYLGDGAANQEDGRMHLDDVAANYEDGRRYIVDGAANQEDGRRYLGDGAANQEDGRMHLDDVAANYEDGRRYIVDGAANQEDGRRYLGDRAANQEDGLSLLDDVATYQEDGRRFLNDGAANQEDGRRYLDDATVSQEGRIFGEPEGGEAVLELPFDVVQGVGNQHPVKYGDKGNEEYSRLKMGGPSFQGRALGRSSSLDAGLSRSSQGRIRYSYPSGNDRNEFHQMKGEDKNGSGKIYQEFEDRQDIFDSAVETVGPRSGSGSGDLNDMHGGQPLENDAEYDDYGDFSASASHEQEAANDMHFDQGKIEDVDTVNKSQLNGAESVSSRSHDATEDLLQNAFSAVTN